MKTFLVILGLIKKLKIKLIIPILLFSSFCFSQSVKRSTICSFGSSISYNGNIIRQSIGQPSNTQTISSSSIGLRQGFQQPVDNNEFELFISKSCNLNVFPNPTIGEEVSIGTDFLNETKLQVNIYDSQGALVYQLSPSVNFFPLNISNFSPGVYMISVSGESNEQCSKKLMVGFYYCAAVGSIFYNKLRFHNEYC